MLLSMTGVVFLVADGSMTGVPFLDAPGSSTGVVFMFFVTPAVFFLVADGPTTGISSLHVVVDGSSTGAPLVLCDIGDESFPVVSGLTRVFFLSVEGSRVGATRKLLDMIGA